MEPVGTSRPVSGTASSSLVASQSSVSRPVSRSADRHHSASGSRPTTALSSVPPDYLRPVVKSAVRRWKRLHEHNMIEKLVQTKEDRRATYKENREKAHKTAKRIPLDLLAKEWLNKERATIETRAYLIESLLPNVILGLEQLLVNVMKRGLAEKAESDPNFNPINFLAQYLMRNNPRYSNFSEASPYIRGLRAVSEELRQEIFQFKDNKLARLKATARKKREDKELMEQQEKLELAKRKVDVQELFEQFLVADNSRVDLAMIQSAVKSFTEVAEQLPEELKKHLTLIFEVQVTEDATRKLSRKEFSDYLNPFIEEMPAAVFVKFREHLSNCIAAYKAALEKEQRKNVLINVFVSCDHDQIGLLDRLRILELFEKFFEQANPDVQSLIRNPTKWPVREVEEELRNIPDEPPPELESEDEDEDEDEEEEKEEEEEKKEEEEKNKEEGEQEGKLETEGGKYENSDQNTLATEKEKSNEISGTMKVVEMIGTEENFSSQDITGAEDEGMNQNAVEEQDNTDQLDDADPNVAVEQEVTDPNVAVEQVTDPNVAVEQEVTDPNVAVEQEVTDPNATVEQKNTKQQEDMDPNVTIGQDDTNPDAGIGQEDTDQNAAEGEKVEEEVKAEEEPTEKKEEEEKKGETEDVVQEMADEPPLEDARPPSAEKGAADETEKEKDEKDEEEKKEAIEEKEKVGEENESEKVLESAPKIERNDVETAGSARPVTSVTFAEGTEFEREKTGLSSMTEVRSQSSVFDEQNVDVTQFVQLSETFLGDNVDRHVLDSLVDFIRDGYQETEEERMARLMKAHRVAMSAKRKKLIDVLFEKWDNDGSGYLEMDEVEAVLFKFKEGSYKKAAATAKKDLRQKSRSHDNRMTKREFRHFLYATCHHFGDEDSLEFLIEFLIQSVERSYAERVRGEARKKWLTLITMAGETGGASMEPVYRAVFQALYKDAEAHGEGKRISANIAMLEVNDVAPEKGPMMLRYVAATPDDAPFLLGRILHKDSNAISFQAVESGKPLHLPRVSASPNVVFFNPDRRDEDKDGSFIAVPLKDQKKRVFGTMGIDTLNDPQKKAIFITHEIQFFQGVAKSFSIAYHHVDVLRKTLRVAESALSWICRRSPSVQNVTYYMKEPDGRTEASYVLRRMLFTDEYGETTVSANPPRLERRDNLFRDYLFKAIDTSESVSSDAYGQRHLAIPMRDLEGLALAVVDIGIGALKELPPGENREVMKMLKLLQMAYSEIAKAAQGDGDENQASNAEMMFDKLMLVDLRNNVAHLDAQAYAELRSYKEPPKTVLNVLQAVLSIFYPEKATAGDFSEWDRCKKYLKVSLSKKIMNYDPQANAEGAPLELILQYMSGARETEGSRSSVERHGSKPARYLYNWVFVCVSLIEHTRKMRLNKKQDSLPPVPEEEEKEPVSV